MSTIGPFKKITALFMAVLVGLAAPLGVKTARAAVYKDVGSTNFFFEAVNAVTDWGLMTGDGSGSFGVNDMISKFSAAVTYANAAGYKYAGYTAAEKSEYDKAYAQFSGDIAAYAAKYAKWDNTANREIAYLLYKGVFTKEDLSGFFRNVDGTDKLRALSKEEACVYLTRLIGKEETAKAANFEQSSKFKDDADIKAEYKPYVYYLRAVGVVTGDEKQNFNPLSAATKGMLALMLYKTRDLLPALKVSSASAGVTVTGVITRVYPAFNAIYVTTDDGDGKIYPVTAMADVKVDGRKAEFAALKEGMDITATVTENGATAIDATSPLSPEPTVTPPPATSTQTQTQTFEGTVTISTASTVSVELRLLTMKGEVYYEERGFAVPATAKVTRNGAAAKISEAAAGDAAIVKTAGQTVVSVDLIEKRRAVTGVILEKSTAAGYALMLTVAEESTNRVYTFAADFDTAVTRNNAAANVADLRVGDSFTAALQYDVILTIAAFGTAGYVSGWVDEMVISSKEYGSKITIVDEQGVTRSYYAGKAATNDFYAVRAGDKVSVRLDSREVEGVTVTANASSDTSANGAMLGYVSAVTGNAIAVTEHAGYGTAETFITDAQTIFLDARTGAQTTRAALTTGARVFVVRSGSVARTITILSN